MKENEVSRRTILGGAVTLAAAGAVALAAPAQASTAPSAATTRRRKGNAFGVVTSSYVDAVTGFTVTTIGKPGSHMSHQYMSSMSWGAHDQTMALCADINFTSLRCTLLTFDPQHLDTTVIDTNVRWAAPTVGNDNRIYYNKIDNQVLAYDIDSGVNTVVVNSPTGTSIREPLSINDACDRLGLFWTTTGMVKDLQIGWADVSDGLLHTSVPAGFFADPHPIANHAQINPVYRDQIFFAHEGLTEMPDRIWSVDTATNTATNLYHQAKKPDGSAGEYVGHETWSHDGERLYFVKYWMSPLPPIGVWFVSRDGSQSGMINGDHPYWHVGVSPDGRYLAADTQVIGGVSKVVVIELATGRSKVIATGLAATNHPAHPHPTFSRSSEIVTFSFLDATGTCTVGTVDISGITFD